MSKVREENERLRQPRPTEGTSCTGRCCEERDANLTLTVKYVMSFLFQGNYDNEQQARREFAATCVMLDGRIMSDFRLLKLIEKGFTHFCTLY